MKKKSRILGRQVWCVECTNKRPPVIRRSDCLVPIRTGHYDLCEDDLSVDKRVMGVCEECLGDKNKFQKENTEPVDINHRALVYRNG